MFQTHKLRKKRNETRKNVDFKQQHVPEINTKKKKINYPDRITYEYDAKTESSSVELLKEDVKKIIKAAEKKAKKKKK